MRCIDVRTGETGPDALYVAHTPVPTLAAGQVLIHVHAAGVNRPDILQRQGKYPAPPGASPILGLEVAGVIAAVAPDVNEWAVGDAVCALTHGGGYAEYVAVDAGSVLPKPEGLSMIEAAACPETVFTVWANVFVRGALQPAETFMVHGANSGIGITAIQMAKAHGARVIATARGADKCAAAKTLGADHVIDTTTADLVEAVTALGGVDVILDMLGGAMVQQNLSCLHMDGRLVQIAFTTGAKVELDLRPIMLKRLTVTGSTLRARTAAEKRALRDGIRATVWPWVARGAVKPLIDRVFDFADAPAAHAHIDSGAHIGKIVLQLQP